MPVVNITWKDGRSREQKQEVIKDITKTLVEKANAKEEDVVIIFNPLDASNLAHGKELLG
ncbi:MAG: 4-oxalocrotonate tautomerase [Chloroflexi bacterium]|nr:4-oxalocrotonate tautomerase [Chloroflexota bacterium]|tara:strand:- start:389 stop:568 length:180 start_codon:yes stop_codon:yes gene_type:complete